MGLICTPRPPAPHRLPACPSACCSSGPGTEPCGVQQRQSALQRLSPFRGSRPFRGTGRASTGISDREKPTHVSCTPSRGRCHPAASLRDGPCSRDLTDVRHHKTSELRTDSQCVCCTLIHCCAAHGLAFLRRLLCRTAGGAGQCQQPRAIHANGWARGATTAAQIALQPSLLCNSL